MFLCRLHDRIQTKLVRQSLIARIAVTANASDHPAQRPSSLRRPPAIVLLNQGSGSVSTSVDVRQSIEQALAELGAQARLIELVPGQSLADVADDAAARAASERAILIAAGGDGTVSTVARACFLRRVALGVVPLGTFNYFAREFGLPEDPASAVRAALTGMPTQIDVGFVNARLFINNASFGIYPRIIRDRERTKAKLGRKRWVAACSGLWTLLRGQRRFAVSIEADGDRQLRRTTMVFVGNNAFQLRQLGLEVADCVAAGRLAAVVQPPAGRLVQLRQLLLGALGRMHREPNLERFCADTLVIDSKRRRIELAIDGELCALPPPLVFSKARRAMTLMLPADTDISRP